MNVTENEVRELENKLVEHGYKKYTSALSSNETFGYFKSFGKDSPDSESKYQIEYRFWDFRHYRGFSNICSPDGFGGVDIIIISSDHMRCDFTIGDIIDIDTAEKIAADYFENILLKYNLF